MAFREREFNEDSVDNGDNIIAHGGFNSSRGGYSHAGAFIYDNLPYDIGEKRVYQFDEDGDPSLYIGVRENIQLSNTAGSASVDEVILDTGIKAIRGIDSGQRIQIEYLGDRIVVTDPDNDEVVIEPQADFSEYDDIYISLYQVGGDPLYTISVEDEVPITRTEIESNISTESVTLNGRLRTDREVDVFFEWGLEEEGLVNQTPAQTINEDTDFSETIDINSAEDYVFRTAVEDGGEVVDEGRTFEFRTESTTPVRLEWTDNSNNEDSFSIWRSIEDNPEFDFGDGDYELVERLREQNVESYSDTKAPESEVISYAVTSYNEDGDSDATFTTVNTNLQSRPKDLDTIQTFLVVGGIPNSPSNVQASIQ